MKATDFARTLYEALTGDFRGCQALQDAVTEAALSPREDRDLAVLLLQQLDGSTIEVVVRRVP